MNPAFICLILLAGTAVATTGVPAPNAEEMAMLQSGQPAVAYTRRESAGGAIRVALLFHVPPEAVWEVLLSCERSFEYVQGLRRCKEVESGLEHALVQQSVKQYWLLPTLDYLIEFERVPYLSIEYHQVEGDLKLLEGRWQFEVLGTGQGTLVTHEMRVQSRFPVPRWLVRSSLADDVPDMLQCLRALTGGSGSDRQAEEDREKCPQDHR